MSGQLGRLHPESGQSAWLDNLQRGYLFDGTLDQLIDRGVRGLTSNPTIFQRAIQGSSDYDEQFGELTRGGKSVLESYWELVLTDINGAMSTFSDLHVASQHVDGFVSVEVDPRLADDQQGTIREARALRARIDGPNVMIKIPATTEGLGAIAAMTEEGCSVNVTLIFGLDRYAQVMEAYIGALERRAARHLPLAGINSVASFFISRVDSEVDARLDAIGTEESARLKGLTAVAQARLAYRLFTDTFSGERWSKLSALGAQVQRPLWASTSTKNPAYPDTLYVDSLIGPLTVNTLPESTLHAFDDHGRISRSIDSDIDGATLHFEKLAHLGVNMADVAHKLEREGVASFISSFEDLLATLRDKATALEH